MNSTKELILSSSALPEMEDEMDNIDEMEYDANIKANCLDLLDAIGTEEFRPVYEILIKEIKTYPIIKQTILCRAILYNLDSWYGFTPFIEMDYTSMQSIQDVYKLLEFVTFDNLEFIVYLLKGIAINIKNKDKEEIRVIFENNWNIIESKLKSYSSGSLVKQFLRCTNRENLLNFFQDICFEKRILITLELLKGELENAEQVNN